MGLALSAVTCRLSRRVHSVWSHSGPKLAGRKARLVAAGPARGRSALVPGCPAAEQ